MLTDCNKYCKETVSELSAKLAHKEKKIQHLKLEKNKMLQRIDELNQKVNTQSDLIKQMRIKIGRYELSSNKLKFENNNLKRGQSLMEENVEQYQRKDNKFKKYERIIAELQNDIQKLSYALEEHKIVRQDNSEEMLRLQIYINELEEKLDNQDHEYKYNNQMLCSQTEQQFNSQIENQFKEKDDQIQEAYQKIELMKQKYQQNIQRIIKICNTVYEELSNRKGGMENIIDKLQFWKNQFDNDDIELDFKDNNLDYDKLQEEYEKMKEEKQKLESTLVTTIQKRECKQVKEMEMMSLIEKLQRQIENQKELNENRLSMLGKEVEKLEKSNKQLSDDNKKLIRDYKDTLVERESLQLTVQRQEKRIQSIQLGLTK